MTSFPEAVRHGFGNLIRFRGRDTRSQFWFFVLALVIGQQVVSGLAVVIVLAGIVDTGFAGNRPPDPQAFFDVVRWVISLAIGTALFGILLAAAAVVRRLHDRGIAGWWGAMPLPFLIFGTAAMLRLFSAFPDPRGFDGALFTAIFLSNAIYMMTLLVLVVLLALPGTSGPNRYGSGPPLRTIVPQQRAAPPPAMPQPPAHVVRSPDAPPFS